MYFLVLNLIVAQIISTKIKIGEKYHLSNGACLPPEVLTSIFEQYNIRLYVFIFAT